MEGMPRHGRATEDGIGWSTHKRILLWLAPAWLLGCNQAQSILAPAGPSARAIAQVWWWMFGVGVAVWIVVVLLWLVAMRRRKPLEGAAAERVSRRWIIGGGIVLPSVSILALTVFGAPAGLHHLSLAREGSGALTVEVTGHQWRWELHYPATGVRLHNELRIPVGRPVIVHTRSADVIHSFWVPRLGGKLDAIPGRDLRMRLQADQAGTFRGQCAEFCGTGHAHMTMIVHAMEPAQFDAWMAGQTPTPAGAAR